MPREQTGRKILGYLTEHAGVPLSLERIAADTGYEAQQVSNAARHLSSLGVTRIKRGMYVYNQPQAKAASEFDKDSVFEYAGITKNGVHLVRSEAGIVYKLVEL